MIYFKTKRSKFANKDGKKLYFPQVVSRGVDVDTLDLARELSQASGASVGDTIGILRNLGPLMQAHLADGKRVKLDGIGSFALRAQARGRGVETAEGVSSQLFNRIYIRFVSEQVLHRASGLRQAALIAPDVRFEKVPDDFRPSKPSKKASGGAAGGSTPPGGSSHGESPNPGTGGGNSEGV